MRRSLRRRRTSGDCSIEEARRVEREIEVGVVRDGFSIQCRLTCRSGFLSSLNCMPFLADHGILGEIWLERGRSRR